MIVSRETRATQFFGDRAELALRYADLLATTAIERGLIGPKEGERIWARHIENCLPITTLIPERATLADIGSGAGLPGIVIALAKPNVQVTLIEPLQRRTEFLYEVSDALGIKIEVVRGKAELLKGAFDLVTARAVAPLPRLKEISWHLIRQGGSLLAIKGESAASELDQLGEGHLHEINLDGIPVSRVIQITKAG